MERFPDLKQRKEQLGCVDAIVSESHFGLSCDANPFRKEMTRQNEKKKYVDIEAIDNQVLNMSIENGGNDQDMSEDLEDNNEYHTTAKTNSKLQPHTPISNLLSKKTPEYIKNRNNSVIN